jgi:hypothetical protein
MTLTAFNVNEILSHFTNAGILNSDSCFTAITLFTLVVARLELSILKPVAVNEIPGTEAVKVMSLPNTEAIAQDTEELTVFVKLARVVELDHVKSSVIAVPSIFMLILSPEIRFLGRLILSIWATAGTFAVA